MKRISGMLKKSTILAATALLMLCGCDFRENLFDTHIKIDREGKQAINTIQQQLDRIRETIPDLEELESSLQTYLSSLEEKAAVLEEEIEKSEDRLSEVEKKAYSDLVVSSGTLSLEISAYRREMSSKLSSLKNAVKELQDADTNLGSRIDELRRYADSEVSDLRSWASASFATLAQYNALCADVTAARTAIDKADSDMEKLSAAIDKAFNEDIPASIENLGNEMKAEVADIAAGIVPAVEAAEAELKTAYEAYFKDGILEYEDSMKAWVNTLLDGYYTKAELDARIRSLAAEMESVLEDNEEYILSLTTSLEKEIRGKVQKYADLVAGYRSETERISGLQEQNAALLRDFGSNADKISAAAGAIADNAAEILRQKDTIAALQEHMDTNSAIIGRIKDAIAEMNAVYDQFDSYSEDFGTALLEQAAKVSENAAAIRENAALIGRNVELLDSCRLAIEANERRIESYRVELAGLEELMKTEYEAAILSATKEMEGRIADSVAVQLDSLNAKEADLYRSWSRDSRKLQTAVNTLKSSVSGLKKSARDMYSALSDMSKDISKLLSRIQSVNWLPDVGDSVAVICDTVGNASAELSFLILPSGTAEALAKVPSSLSVLALTSEGESSAGALTATAEGDVLSISLQIVPLPDSFKAGDLWLALRISDGNNDRQSDYIPATMMITATE